MYLSYIYYPYQVIKDSLQQPQFNVLTIFLILWVWFVHLPVEKQPPVSDDKIIRFWGLKQSFMIAPLDGFVEIIYLITSSPNRYDMAIQDGSIKLYNLSFPQNIHDLQLEEIMRNRNYMSCYNYQQKIVQQGTQIQRKEANQLKIMLMRKGAQQQH